MKTSAIGWTDYSGGDLNFVRGCTPVSEGCAHCYARRIYERFGRDFSVVTFHEDKLDRLRRKRFPEHSPRRGRPHKPMAFVVDTGDLFHELVPPEFIADAFDIMADRQDVIWQVLTKRPERMLREARRWCESKGMDTLPTNVWLGVTAENQRCADERIPILVDTPAAVRFVSVEPMLEPMDLRWHLVRLHEHTPRRPGCGLYTQATAPKRQKKQQGPIHLVICGAESGPKRRPFDVAWAVDLYEQCRDAGIPFFGKQTGALYPGEPLVLGDYGVVHEWPEADGWGAQDDEVPF
jgi:protein gp37